MLMLSPTRFLARWCPSVQPRLRPVLAPLFLSAGLLAVGAVPAPSQAQCRPASLPEIEVSYELRMLRSGMEGWKYGCVEVKCFHTSTRPHIQTRILQTDSVSHTPEAIDDFFSAKPIPDLPSWFPRIDVSQKDVSWPYARGRAVLATTVPVAVGGTLLRLRPHDRMTNTMGLAVGGLGLLVGPAMGQWCLGGPHTRTGVLYTAARASGMGGIGGIVWALQSGETSTESADLLKLPVVALAAAVGIGLAAGLIVGFTLRAIDETPRRRCDAEHDKRVAVSLAAHAPTSGRGVRLSIRL